MRCVFAILFAVSVVACAGPRESPEPFVREVVAAVATSDFDRYWALSSHTMDALAGSDSRLPGQGLGSALAPVELNRVRDEFDRVVRTRRIRPGDAASLEPVLVATELERWVFELFDPSGRGIGIQIALRSWNDGYRTLRMYPVEPGSMRESVGLLEG
jgi:hypothetical protein